MCFPLPFTVSFAVDEINLLISEIRRLENGLQSTELPMSIARDCLGNRQRRIDTDLVQDNAEKQLLKVKNLLVLAEFRYEQWAKEIDGHFLNSQISTGTFGK